MNTMAMVTNSKVFQCLLRPRDSLGRLFFSEHGSVFDGRIGGPENYIGCAESVAELLMTAAYYGWRVMRVPSRTRVKTAEWHRPLGVLVFEGEDFEFGRLTKSTNYENSD